LALKVAGPRLAKDWAVFGKTKEDTLQKFYEAEAKHAKIALREDDGAEAEYEIDGHGGH
jgi:hypothetical protein